VKYIFVCLHQKPFSPSCITSFVSWSFFTIWPAKNLRCWNKWPSLGVSFELYGGCLKTPPPEPVESAHVPEAVCRCPLPYCHATNKQPNKYHVFLGLYIGSELAATASLMFHSKTKTQHCWFFFLARKAFSLESCHNGKSSVFSHNVNTKTLVVANSEPSWRPNKKRRLYVAWQHTADFAYK